ncbi:hypothetical protein CDD81_2447 [Ophiocordyceps australis]|uniref:Meiotic recombination protein DMC1 n=1 Tax=Ophiocordyceps australis TaxID=1399860 RepID=A0A2C5XXK9_9HYPO|nr:hypothetical protein CDD81_2447 [Ophiocordyceps australis]
MSSPHNSQPGGFFPPSSVLPSPAPSSTSATSSAAAVSALPHPRGKALLPNTKKEDMVRRFAEQRLLDVSRRYVKKFAPPDPQDTIVGFRSFTEVCREFDGLVNILWRSGTPSLQIPFLLRLASDFTQYVRSFPPAPRPTFALLRKLDHCFASLLRGADTSTNEALPGFENGLRMGMTVTDMVRCRSIVEQTRVLVVEIMSQPAPEEEEDEEWDGETGTETETEDGMRFAQECDDDDDEARLHMDAARVFEKTIVQLGERLGEPLGE